MNVKGITPIDGNIRVYQKISGKRIFSEKSDSFEKKDNEEKKDFKTRVKEFFQTMKKETAVILSSLLTGLAVFAIASKKNIQQQQVYHFLNKTK